MPDRFHKIYRISSSRLPRWDYSSNGYYFVTICTKEKEHYFGEIINGEMELSKIGEVVAREWQNTEAIRLDVEVDEWVVMPNHLHGIINIVETHCSASLQQKRINKFGPQSNNLASIIRGFKSKTTKDIRMAGFNAFAWQPRFYDHVIRNDASLNRIREYIQNNPTQWDLDIENNANKSRDALQCVSTTADYYKKLYDEL
ncbi:MAG: transposase [Candidatus Omnitrophota bacterium]